MSNDNVIPLRPTPKHFSDDEFVRTAWDLACELIRAQSVNPECAFIDLTRRYKITAERRPSLYRMPEWFAIDELTFDPDPDSLNHIVGTGTTEQDAKMDLQQDASL